MVHLFTVFFSIRQFDFLTLQILYLMFPRLMLQFAILCLSTAVIAAAYLLTDFVRRFWQSKKIFHIRIRGLSSLSIMPYVQRSFIILMKIRRFHIILSLILFLRHIFFKSGSLNGLRFRSFRSLLSQSYGL